MTQTKEADRAGRRVYEYVAEDGTVYYSFTRHPTMVVPTQRLYLQSRLGNHLLNFLVKMRHRGDELTAEGRVGSHTSTKETP